MAEKPVNKRKLLIKKLKSRFRLQILNEKTFEEMVSYSLTPMNVIIMFGGLLLVFGTLIYLLVAFTPLKAYVIPDFTDYGYREDARVARLQADSLLEVARINEQYIRDLRTVLTGGELRNQADTGKKEVADVDLNYTVTDVDQAMRNELSSQDRYTLDVSDSDSKEKKNILLFKPTNGSITERFDPKAGKMGIDLAAPKDEPVRAVMDGTVILATFSSTDGNVIQIQHSNGMVSVYKNNASLIKKSGDRVRAGESIAFVGSSADRNKGTHLHFELWLNAIPVNPLDYIPN